MDVQFEWESGLLDNLQEFDTIVCPFAANGAEKDRLARRIHKAAGIHLDAALKDKQLPEGEMFVTEGFNLGIKRIIHIAVPKYSEAAAREDALYNCYKTLLIPPGRTIIYGVHPEAVVIGLLGCDTHGWSYEQSLDALWRVVLEYQHQYTYVGILNRIRIHYPADRISCGVIDRYTNRASRAFFDRPKEWGRYISPGFWYALMDHFDDPKFNNIPLSDFIREIQRLFHDKTGQWICGDTRAEVPEWMIHPFDVVNFHFASRAIPVLCSNLCKLGFSAHEDSLDFILPVTLDGMQLTLPYEILSELTQLRKDGRELTEHRKIWLELSKTYFLTTYHYRNAPDLIDCYCLDVEKASDSHYKFSVDIARRLCGILGYHPKALGAALTDVLKTKGGAYLESMLVELGAEAHHFN